MSRSAPCLANFLVIGEREGFIAAHSTMYEIDQPVGLVLAQRSIQSQLRKLKVEARAERLPWLSIMSQGRPLGSLILFIV